MNHPTEIRMRISRFVGERYQYREHPGYVADVILWGVIVIIALCPMVTLLHAMELLK